MEKLIRIRSTMLAAALITVSVCSVFVFTAYAHVGHGGELQNGILDYTHTEDREVTWVDSDPPNDPNSLSSGIIHVLVNNLHGGPSFNLGGLDETEEVRMGEYIASIRPDIALLQESGYSQDSGFLLSKSRWWSGEGAGAEKLCDTCTSDTFTTMNHPDWVKNELYNGAQYNGDGLSTWTSMPISNIAHVDYTDFFGHVLGAMDSLNDGAAIKGFTFARVAVGPNNQEIHFYNSHTDSGFPQGDMDMREQQILEELGAWIRDYSDKDGVFNPTGRDYPVIVVGDWNTEIIAPPPFNDPDQLNPDRDIETLLTFRFDHNLHDARDFFGQRPNSRGWIWREKWGGKYIEGFDQIYFRSGDEVTLTLVDFMMDEPFITDHPMLHGYFHWSVDDSLPQEVNLSGSHMYEFRQGQSDYVSIDGSPPEVDPSFVDMHESSPRGFLNNDPGSSLRVPELDNNRDKYNQCCDYLQLGFPAYHTYHSVSGGEDDFYRLTQAPPELSGGTSNWTMMISVALHVTPPFCDDHKGADLNCTWGQGFDKIVLPTSAAALARFPSQPIFNNVSGAGQGFKLYLDKLHASPLNDDTLTDSDRDTPDWRDDTQGAYWNQFCLDWGSSHLCSGPITENDLDHNFINAGKPGMHTIQPDHWYDITITHDSDGNMTMFADGREVKNWTASTSYDFGGDGDLWLGQDVDRNLYGGINVEHMYFFDRVLTKDERTMMRSHNRLLPAQLVCAPVTVECGSPDYPDGIEPPPDLIVDDRLMFSDDESALVSGLGTVIRTWEGFVLDFPIEYKAMCTQLITIVDTTSPTIGGPPDDMTLDATSANGTVVTFPLPTATDLCDPAPVVVCDPPSGSQFAPGESIVTCTATDSSGNQASYDFTVTVRTAAETIEDLIDSLRALLPTGDAKTDRRIEMTIRRLESSLNNAYWEGGFALTDSGGKTFGGVTKAILLLLMVEPSDPALEDSIARLLAVQRILAQTALDAAIASAGHPAHITASQRAMQQGDNSNERGRYSDANEFYRIAWAHATQAVR